MICFPNAKINIGLNVVEKRPDGYHNIETVFFPIPIKEALEVVHLENNNAPYIWSNSGITVDTPAENNICIKALNLIKQDHTLTPIQIHLHKQIPFGAGLGGGSADGACMLKLLNDFFKLNISTDDLKQYAVQLGADCPFFIDNHPALATGIGEILKPIELDLSGYHLALIKPDIHVSTPEAYAGIVPAQSATSLKEDIHRPIEEWKEYIKNDFEKSVFTKYPLIGELKEQLYQQGALYAAMSGSGSSVFGIFKETPAMDAFQDHYCWVGEL